MCDLITDEMVGNACEAAYGPKWSFVDAEGMRAALTAALPLIRGAVVEECADVAHKYWEEVVSYHGHVPTDPIEAMTKAAQEIEVAIGWLTAKPRKKD